MPDFLVPVLHFAALAALGALTRSRLLVVLSASVGIVWRALVSDPDDLRSMSVEWLALTFGGFVLGAVVGLWAAGAQARRAREARRIAREVATGRKEPPPPRSGLHPAVWVLGVLLLAVGGAVGLYVEGETVPAWRKTVDGWRATPTARSLGLGPATGASANGAAGSKPGGTARAGDRAGDPAGERTRVRNGGPADRPQGDMRHCLERGGSTQDVLRCAEQRR